MSEFRTRMAGKLSGGMKQKLGLVCALIHRPKVILLDEPTTGVDPVSRRDFWRILYELARRGRRDSHFDRLSRRGRALPSRRAHAPGPTALLRHAREPEGSSLAKAFFLSLRLSPAACARSSNTLTEYRAWCSPAMECTWWWTMRRAAVPEIRSAVLKKQGSPSTRFSRLRQPSKTFLSMRLQAERSDQWLKTANSVVIENLVKRFGRLRCGRPAESHSAQGRSLRISRTERRRQVNHHSHAVRPAEAKRGPRRRWPASMWPAILRRSARTSATCRKSSRSTTI